jgi:hypothetical protein
MCISSFDRFFSRLSWSHFLPAPARLYSSAGSTIVAAAIGGIYGLAGRVIYPKAGISSLNYAVWFACAFQIKECINLLEFHFESFMGVSAYFEELEKTPEDQLNLKDKIRYHCWRIVHLKNHCLRALDQAACKILAIRPSQDISAHNVEDASFLEMCRYRIWPVFKSTIIDTVCSGLAYRVTNGMGFTLPQQASATLFIVIRSIIKDILLIPALYVYARVCNHLAEELGDGDQRSTIYRVVWIRRFLPSL